MDTPKQNDGDPTPEAGNWPDGFAPDPPSQELVPGTYGNLTILPGAVFTLTPEELTWPVVDYSVHPPRVKSRGEPNPPART